LPEKSKALDFEGQVQHIEAAPQNQELCLLFAGLAWREVLYCIISK
jgi:hypothetical protein